MTGPGKTRPGTTGSPGTGVSDHPAAPRGRAGEDQTVAPRAAALAVAAGCGLLTARPALVGATTAPVAWLVALFAMLLVVAVAWPMRGPTRSSHVVIVAVLGVGAFGLGRLVGGGHPPAAFTVRVVMLNSLAAVAEEAFFRRLAYAVLVPSGVAWAVGGSALLFTLVHLTSYGAWVLPIDLAAGLVLGWQRWASGSWRVPALTHVLANLLVVL